MDIVDSLSNIVSLGEGFSSTAMKVYNLVGAIASGFDNLQNELEYERVELDRELMGDFRSAVWDVKQKASSTREMFSNLRWRWSNLSSEINRAIRWKKTLTDEQVRKYKDKVLESLSYASLCEGSYQEFRDTLNYAMRIAFGLQSRAQDGASEARSNAENTRIGGYSAAGVMSAGAVACAVAAFFTGGLSLIGTAVLGAGAAAAAAETKERAAQFDKLASEFQSRLNDIELSIRSMNRYADQVESARQRGQSVVAGLEDQMYRLNMGARSRSKRS